MSSSLESTEPLAPLQREERRERLLNATVAQIAARGFGGVRLRDVAVSCGVTTGMLQYYFASREQLLIAAFEYAALSQIAGWRAAVAGEPNAGERLPVLLGQMIEEFSSQATCATWAELGATAARHAELRPIVSHVFDEWQAILREVVGGALAAGSISVVLPVDDAIGLLIASFDGYELDLASSAGNTTPETAARQILLLAKTLFPTVT
jgi:AcrR family transcriptional regulator